MNQGRNDEQFGLAVILLFLSMIIIGFGFYFMLFPLYIGGVAISLVGFIIAFESI